MAAKLDLLLSFNTGQGISGGLQNYINYPSDHDANYLSIQTTVNQVIDEVNGARLADSQIPGDMLTSDDVSDGRYAAEDAAVSRSGNTVTVSSGPTYLNGQKVIVQGQTFDFAGLPNATYRIATDVNGLLNNSTATGAFFFDLVNVVWDGSMVDADVTDLIFQDGEVLNAIKHGYLQEPGNPPGEITNVFDVDYPARLKPHLRFKTREGALLAAGVFAGVDNALAMTSGLDGSSDTVMARIWGSTGQVLELEQSRVMVTRTTSQAIVTATNTPVEWDTLPASNTAGVAERFEPQSYVASTDWQNGVNNIDVAIPNSTAYNGTYLFTAVVNLALDDSVATYLDVIIQQTVGGAAVVARHRCFPSGTSPTLITLSGMYDFLGGDEFQLQVEHNHGANINLDFARMTMILVGGGV